MFLKLLILQQYPKKKSEPKRALICILGTFLGGVLSLIFVFFTHYILPQKNKIQE